MKRYNFILNLLLDLLIFFISSILSFFIRFFILRFGTPFEFRNFIAYLRTLPLLTLIFIILFYLYGLYTEKESWYEEFSSILSSLFLLFLFKFTFSFLLGAFAYPRSVIIISLFIESVLFLLYRYLFFVKRKEVKKTELALVIGNEEIIDKYKKIEFKNINSFEDLENIKNNYNSIFYLSRDEILKNKLLSFGVKKNKKIYINPDLTDLLIFSSKIKNISEKPFFEISKIELSAEKKILKRSIDLFFSIILLIILTPIFLIIPLLIKLSSKGRVFYIQERVGENNKIFKLIKFRTMIENAEQETGPSLSYAQDPRVTKIGKFLRKYHIDEIPQLINVLKGEMSLVGPRPERPEFLKEIIKIVPYFEYRVRLKPGITGLAQVEGKYETPPEDKIKYDLIYILKWSPFLDFYIILLTLKKIFKWNYKRNKYKNCKF